MIDEGAVEVDGCWGDGGNFSRYGCVDELAL